MGCHQKLLKFDCEAIKSIIPKLSHGMHKGQAGRVAIIGGSREYTGAPYFAGMTALRLGIDLVHIFCPEAAGQPIKCYSPDLIIHPMLSDYNGIDQLDNWLPRMSSVVFGPGMGRDNVLQNIKLLEAVKKLSCKTVIDADGLFAVSKFPNLLKDFPNVVLTPNAVEYRRLMEACTDNAASEEEQLTQFFEKYEDVTLVVKGNPDRIYTSQNKVEVSGGGLCRCGGQGDVLSGAIATFMLWGGKLENNTLLGVYAGCYFTKELSAEVFRHKGRSMVTNDFFTYIHPVFKHCFDLEY